MKIFKNISEFAEYCHFFLTSGFCNLDESDFNIQISEEDRGHFLAIQFLGRRSNKVRHCINILTKHIGYKREEIFSDYSDMCYTNHYDFDKCLTFQVKNF